MTLSDGTSPHGPVVNRNRNADLTRCAGSHCEGVEDISITTACPYPDSPALQRGKRILNSKCFLEAPGMVNRYVSV